MVSAASTRSPRSAVFFVNQNHHAAGAHVGNDVFNREIRGALKGSLFEGESWSMRST
jgi:hypothetical protein